VTVYVKVFADNQQANRFRYSATTDAVHDIGFVMSSDIVSHLIEIAKRDVVDGIK